MSCNLSAFTVPVSGSHVSWVCVCVCVVLVGIVRLGRLDASRYGEEC